MKYFFIIQLFLFQFISLNSSDKRIPENNLNDIINKTVDNKKIFGAVVSIYDGNEIWTGAAGNFSYQSSYFIASITKLYVTAIILKLKDDETLRLEDKISEHLSTDIIDGLHIYKNKEYSENITIKQLLSHTSGLPDYFEEKGGNGLSLKKEIISGRDQSWTFYDAIERSKIMKPKMAPGTKRKAFYSDTNYQLLGEIIESVTGKKLSDCIIEYIYNKLGLVQTYMYSDINDKKPKSIYHRNNVLEIPKAMASFQADGGIVSTAEESMIFLRAFFDGRLFDKQNISEIQEWNPIFFPFEYGTGIARVNIPKYISPFKKAPLIIGHPATSGAFAYYCPEKNVYITGTINQAHNPRLPYKLIYKILDQIESIK